jgi:hypothetical protein
MLVFFSLLIVAVIWLVDDNDG